VKPSAQKDKRQWLDNQDKEAVQNNIISTLYQVAKMITRSMKSSSGPVKANDDFKEVLY
jgi:hypothetical protein